MTLQKKNFAAITTATGVEKGGTMARTCLSSCNKSTASGNSIARSPLTGDDDTAHDTQFSHCRHG